MARLKICDNRSVLWQWDTGIEVELCECNAQEMHFESVQGTIKRTLNDGVCTIPDVCLQRAGCLICYAFAAGENKRYTKHEFRLKVVARPKPADYIDPYDEQTGIDAIVTRLKSDSEFLTLTKGVKGDNGKTPVKGVDYFTDTDVQSITTNVKSILIPKLELLETYETPGGEGNAWTFTMKNFSKPNCIGYVGTLCVYKLGADNKLVFGLGVSKSKENKTVKTINYTLSNIGLGTNNATIIRFQIDCLSGFWNMSFSIAANNMDYPESKTYNVFKHPLDPSAITTAADYPESYQLWIYTYTGNAGGEKFSRGSSYSVYGMFR